jgi:hypothetical protein
MLMNGQAKSTPGGDAPVGHFGAPPPHFQLKLPIEWTAQKKSLGLAEPGPNPISNRQIVSADTSPVAAL